LDSGSWPKSAVIQNTETFSRVHSEQKVPRSRLMAYLSWLSVVQLPGCSLLGGLSGLSGCAVFWRRVELCQSGIQAGVWVSPLPLLLNARSLRGRANSKLFPC